jgi:catechol 2,3-dioxygenase-like lactoylglutathione lyase family enzyme
MANMANHNRMFRFLSSLILFAAVAAPAAQAPQSAPPGQIVGVGNFAHIVQDLDKSLAFYRDVLGLEVAMSQPFGPNPAIEKLGNTPGGQSRFVALKVPGSALGVELIEYKDIERRAQHPRFHDPGAANLALRVRDVDELFARAMKVSGVKVITVAGQPVTIETPNGMLHVVFLQDPDGFVVELAGAAAAQPGEPTGPILGANFESTVANSEQSVTFYNDLLGFTMQLGASFNANKQMAETAGAPGARFRQSSAPIPGTTARMTFIEFKDIDRTPLQGRVQDPGTAILQLRVRDVVALTKRLKAAGVPVVTAGGEPVDVINGIKIAIVRDPNNLLLELIQAE